MATALKERILLCLMAALLLRCESDGSMDRQEGPSSCFEQLASNSEWSQATEVEIDGYSANAMEPKLSADQVVLFWNDKPASDDLMNIHYAIKQSNNRYLYVGIVPGTEDANHLDGVPSIDSSGNFYFVSTRSYSTNYQTIYGGQVNVLGPNSLAIVNVAPADAAASLKKNGTLDMDIDVSWDGNWMVTSRAEFSGKPYPDTSKLVLFTVSSRSASPYSESDRLLKNVNYSGCTVYAGTLSADLKELYFTLFPTGTPEADKFRIVVAKRNSIQEPFGQGAVIENITGASVEGPSISSDGKKLFFHKKDSATNRFKIYQVTRP